MSIFSWFSSSNATPSTSSNSVPDSQSSTSACPVAHDSPLLKPDAASSSGSSNSNKCPVDHGNSDAVPAEHPFLKAQDVLRPGLKRGLSTEREVSSIPRLHGAGQSDPSEFASSGHAAPDSDNNANWVYPSPAQFYSALQKKDRNEANASDMDMIVPIHNAVNEKCWADVLKWELNEAQAKSEEVKLVSFKGRPSYMSPRARIYSMLGYSKPFDRHDWVVDRAGKRTRYVIDFYSGRAGPLSFYLDVRPALDDLDGAFMRTKRFWGKFLPQSQPQQRQQQQQQEQQASFTRSS